MSFNSEMTSLADAIRAKSGVSGKLTITEMTDAVDGIEINQGSDIDLTGVNVTSDKMLAGTVAINASGNKVTGNIQAVTATKDGNRVTVPSGHVASQQIVTVGTAKSAATITPGTSDQTIAADTYLSGKQTIKGDANLTAENIKSGVRIFAVTGTFEGSGGGGTGGSGTFDLAKVTEYTPYAPAMTQVTSVVVSGIGDWIYSDDPESEDYEYNKYYSEANGTYNVTPETAGETDWKKRVYKHESKEYYLYYEYYDDYPDESTWFFSTSMDSDGQFIRKYNEYDWDTDEPLPVGDLESGESEWGDYDWEPFYVTLDVRTTAIPETPMVLKGVLATGYADGEWSFDTAEKSFAGFEYMPSVGNLYATNGDTLIGMSIGIPGGILYLRFRIDKIRGSGEGVQFSEFLLFDKDGNPVFLNTLNLAEISADEKNSSPSGEDPEKAFDGEVSNGNSKWCSMPFNNPSWVQVRFSQPVVIADYPQYGWYTANDSTGRDPVSWSVLVSTDGVAWTPISVVDSYATPTARGVLAGKWEF